MLSLQVIFWALLFLIFYIYFGYPIFLFLLSRVISRQVHKGAHEPSVTVLIAAHNEAAHIGKTIENKLLLNYPREKLEIIVISDGSTDETDEIVASFKKDGVKLLRQEPRGGKTAALNRAVPEAQGEILVFSDANSIYERDALRKLMKNLSDPLVGYVTGKMVYMHPEGSLMGEGCSTYMRYENVLRQFETRLGSIVGVDGGIDAMRRSLYRPMRADQLPDFILPLTVIEQGYRVVYEPEAILWEETLTSTRDEYRMRVRVALRSLWALKEMKQLLNIWKFGLFSMQLFLHKVLRYLAFLFIILLYLSNLMLWRNNPFYQLVLILQTVLYISACLGYYIERRGAVSRYLGLPYYFFLVNLAAAHAFVKFLAGTRQVIWTPRTG